MAMTSTIDKNQKAVDKIKETRRKMLYCATCNSCASKEDTVGLAITFAATVTDLEQLLLRV